MTDYSGLYFYCALIFVIPVGAFAIFINLAFLIRKYRDTRWLYILAAVFSLFCAYLACAFFFRIDN